MKVRLFGVLVAALIFSGSLSVLVGRSRAYSQGKIAIECVEDTLPFSGSCDDPRIMLSSVSLFPTVFWHPPVQVYGSILAVPSILCRPVKAYVLYRVLRN